MLTCQRDLFSLPPDTHYLNCAYLGPLMKSVEAAGIEGMHAKANPTRISAQDFFTGSEAVRRRFATLINAQPNQVALVPSVSYGVAIASQNFDLRKTHNVVMPGEEFPSNVYAWMDRCARDGAELRIVERPRDVQSTGRNWNARILEAIDANTAVVTLTAVHWTDGTRFELEEIGARAREVGALFIVDGTQSIGALPFDFQRVQPDLLVCAAYKWLLGPYQQGFAVVGERLIDAQPFEMSWQNREDSEDFARLVDYTTAYQPGARRFDAGEHANFILVPMLDESIRQILEWGVESIQEYCAGLGRELEEALGGNDGFTVNPPEERGAHLFGVRVPNARLIPAILEQLARRKVYVSQRGTSLRVSPNVYNAPEDMAALAEALRAAVT
ncbi:MAG: aminotransferase class V-fold PLP-dependent enzyme [SAR324 cluster bacterium]|nr:aminotransferase class V-fold PLP-dependent enzyme [SAR324 cluster bacterium]